MNTLVTRDEKLVTILLNTISDAELSDVTVNEVTVKVKMEDENTKKIKEINQQRLRVEYEISFPEAYQSHVNSLKTSYKELFSDQLKLIKKHERVKIAFSDALGNFRKEKSS